MKEFAEAKAANDDKRVKELEAWGKKHQRELHRQGFAIVPVNNLLEHVKDKLPAVAQKTGVVAIVRACDFTASNVISVDVTDELVKIFEPSEKTLKTIAEIRKVEPVDLDALASHEH